MYLGSRKNASLVVGNGFGFCSCTAWNSTVGYVLFFQLLHLFSFVERDSCCLGSFYHLCECIDGRSFSFPDSPVLSNWSSGWGGGRIEWNRGLDQWFAVCIFFRSCIASDRDSVCLWFVRFGMDVLENPKKEMVDQRTFNLCHLVGMAFVSVVEAVG